MTRSGRIERVVLADDHPVVLAGVRSLLAAVAGEFEVVAVRSDGALALEAIRDTAPEIAVLDINMPRLTGLDVLQAVRESGLTTRVVLLTASVEDGQISRAVAGDAWGIVLKDAAGDELVECLRHVASGQRWLPPDVIGPALERDEERRASSDGVDKLLTARERQLAIMVAEGLSNKHISRATGIAEGTVKIHLHNIYQKLNVANRTALAAFAQRHWTPRPGDPVSSDRST